MKAMEELSGLSKGNSYDKIYGFFKKYYFDCAQEYFPQTLYNTTAKELYENAKIAQNNGLYTNDTDPITQSLGDHYSAERRWLSKRILYMMSKYGYGDFSNGGADAIIVRVAGDTIGYDITPAIWMYPCIAHGTSLIQGTRTKAGETCHIDINMGGSADQQNSILGANFLQDIGEWHDKHVDKAMTVTGKMLTELKIGHKTKDIVISIDSLSITNTPALKYLMLSRVSTLGGTLDLTGCKRLEECYIDGTSITQPKFATGCGLKKVEFSSVTNYIIFRSLPLLTNNGVDISTCKKIITDFSITDCPNMQPINMLYDIYSNQKRGGINLKRIRCIGFNEFVPDGVIDMLYEMSLGEYNGMDSNGVGTTGLPVFEGSIHVTNAALRNLELVQEAFPQLTITCDNIVKPTGYNIKITSKTSFYENERIQLSATVSNTAYPEIKWTIYNAQDFNFDEISIGENDGLITLHFDPTNESYNKRLNIRAISPHNTTIYASQTINIMGTKVSTISIDNNGVLESGDALIATLGPTSHTKPNGITWSTSNEDIITIDNNGVVAVLSNETSVVTITAKYELDETVSTHKTFLVNDSVIATRESNPELLRIAYNNMWCESSTEFYASEAFAIKSIGTAFSDSDIKNLDEFKYFGINAIPYNAFRNCTQLKRLILPEHITSVSTFNIGSKLNLDYLEIRCSNFNCNGTTNINIKELTLLHDVINSESYPFNGVENLHLSDNITTIPVIQSSVLKYVNIPCSVKNVLGFAPTGTESSFYITFDIADNCNIKLIDGCLTDKNETIIYKYNIKDSDYTIPNNFTMIGAYAFACVRDNITCNNNITSIGKNAFFNANVSIGQINNADNGAFKMATVTNDDIVISGSTSGKTFESTVFVCDTLTINCTFDNDLFVGASISPTKNCEITLSKNTKCVAETINISTYGGSLFGSSNIIYDGTLSDYVVSKYIGLITSSSPLHISGVSNWSALQLDNNINKIENGVFFNFNNDDLCIYSDHSINIGKHAFYKASLHEINCVGNIDEYAFANSKLSNIEFINCNNIAPYAFNNTLITNITIPDGIVTLESSCFRDCSLLTTIALPKTISTLGSDCFRGCVKANTLYCKAFTAPYVSSSTFGSNGTYIGQLTQNKKLYVPITSNGYDQSYWDSVLCSPTVCDFNKDYIYEPTECVELTITADDVEGYETHTTIYYNAVTNGYDPCTETYVYGYTLTGKVQSEEFAQNTSYTDKVNIEVSFTFMGVTRTVVIEQNVYTDTYFIVDTNNEWRINENTDMNPDPNIYAGLYESFINHHIDNQNAVMYVTITGYETFSMLVRSHGESGFDYVIVSNLDTEINQDDNSTIKMTTEGIANGDTTLLGYTTVTFDNIDKGSHVITIMYKKDVSSSQNSDRGYLLIPKNQ